MLAFPFAFQLAFAFAFAAGDAIPHFVASTIIGVSQLGQLDDNLAAADLVSDDEIMQQIDDIHVEIPLAMTEDSLRYL